MRIKRIDPNKLFANELNFLIKKSRTDQSYQISEAYYKNLPAEKRNALIDRKLTGKNIALITDKSQRTISTYVRGDVIPSENIRESILDEICKAIGKERSSLFEKVSDEKIYNELCIDESKANPFEPETEENKTNRLKDLHVFFQSLQKTAQQYVLAHLTALQYAAGEDFFLSLCFSRLESVQKQYLISLLENFAPDYTQIRNKHSKKNCIKMNCYLEMTYQYEPNQDVLSGNVQKTSSASLSQFDTFLSGTDISFSSEALHYLLQLEPDVWYFLYLYSRMRIVESSNDALSLDLRYLISNAIYNYLANSFHLNQDTEA